MRIPFVKNVSLREMDCSTFRVEYAQLEGINIVSPGVSIVCTTFRLPAMKNKCLNAQDVYTFKLSNIITKTILQRQRHTVVHTWKNTSA